MDDNAIGIVREYAMNSAHSLMEQVELAAEESVFIVWKCKVLQNWKWMIGTTLDNKYYEVTYNGDKNEFYLDVYNQIDNKIY